MKTIKVLMGLAFLTACAQMQVKRTQFVAKAPISELKCSPKVFFSKEEATELGEIEEVCSVTAGVGLTLSEKSAVESLKPKVCECGANSAYVLHTESGVVGNKTATLIGFVIKGSKKTSQVKK